MFDPRELLQQLDARDASQSRCFVDVIADYANLLKTTRESAAQRSMLAGLQRELAAREAVAGGMEVDQQLRAKLENQGELMKVLEGKLYQCQEELTEVYRKKDGELEQRTKQFEDTSKKAETLQRLVEELERDVKGFAGQLDEKGVLETLLRDELQVSQLEITQHMDRKKQLEEENQMLITHLHKIKLEQVEKMNEALSMHNEAQVLRDKLRTEVVRRRSESKAMTTPLADEDLPVQRHSLFVSSSPPRRHVKKVVAHDGEVNTISYNSTGRVFATGSSDTKVRTWDASTGSMLSRFHGCSKGVLKVAFNNTDDLLVAVSNDYHARVWKCQTGRLAHTFTGHMGEVHTVAFNGDSSKLVTGSKDRTIKFWDMKSGYPLLTFFTVSCPNDLALRDVSGTSIITGHQDSSIRVWDGRNKEAAHTLTGAHTGPITSLSLAQGRETILSLSRDNTLKLTDLRMMSTVATFSADSFKIGVNHARAVLSPNGEYVAAGSTDGTVYVWNTASKQVETTLEGKHAAAVVSVDWSPNGVDLLSCDRKQTVNIWTA